MDSDAGDFLVQRQAGVGEGKGNPDARQSMERESQAGLFSQGPPRKPSKLVAEAGVFQKACVSAWPRKPSKLVASPPGPP